VNARIVLESSSENDQGRIGRTNAVRLFGF